MQTIVLIYHVQVRIEFHFADANFGRIVSHGRYTLSQHNAEFTHFGSHSLMPCIRLTILPDAGGASRLNGYDFVSQNRSVQLIVVLFTIIHT